MYLCNSARAVDISIDRYGIGGSEEGLHTSHRLAVIAVVGDEGWKPAWLVKLLRKLSPRKPRVAKVAAAAP